MSDKCEGCRWYRRKFFRFLANGRADYGCAHRDYCHLTLDYLRFMDAMFRGVFDCGRCQLGKPTAYRPGEYVLCECKARTLQGDMREVGKWPCEFWQERKEGEDG